MQADGKYWCGGELDPHPSHPQPMGPSEGSSWVRWGERKTLPKVNISTGKWAPPSPLFLLPPPPPYPRVNPLGLGKVLNTMLRLCVASKLQVGLFSSLFSGSGTAKPGTIHKLPPGPLHASYRMIHHSLQIKRQGRPSGADGTWRGLGAGQAGSACRPLSRCATWPRTSHSPSLGLC